MFVLQPLLILATLLGVSAQTALPRHFGIALDDQGVKLTSDLSTFRFDDETKQWRFTVPDDGEAKLKWEIFDPADQDKKLWDVEVIATATTGFPDTAEYTLTNRDPWLSINTNQEPARLVSGTVTCVDDSCKNAQPIWFDSSAI